MQANNNENLICAINSNYVQRLSSPEGEGISKALEFQLK